MKKISHEEYVSRVKNINPDVEVLDNYLNSSTKIKHRCSCGNDNWFPTPLEMLHNPNRKCSICSGNKKCTHEEYLDKVKKNNPHIKVVGKYINSVTKILHKCSCGKEWFVQPIWISTGHVKSCGKCERQMTDIFIDEVFNNWTVLNIDKNNVSNKYNVLCKCKCGTVKYNYAADLIKSKTTKCKKCSDKETGIKNTYTHKKYLNMLENLHTRVKLKEGQIYKTSDKKIIHICSCCKKDWLVVPSAVLSGQSMCRKCANGKFESFLATMLKQVLKHEYPKTEWEHDLGFKGNKGRVSPYDIFVPELNLVIECQSGYHDNEEQKELDIKKKNFAVEKGYDYKEIDHRYIKPIDALKMFFPSINSIPDYVDFNKNTIKKWSVKEAQELLDAGYSYKEIAKKVGASYKAIVHHIGEGKLIKPENYVCRNQRTWDINKVQSLLNEKKYSYAEIAKIIGNNCTNSAIECAIASGILVRPKYRVRINRNIITPIVQLNLKGDVIANYEDISDIKGFKNPRILDACKSNHKKNHHKYSQYIWFYKSEYELLRKNFDVNDYLPSLKPKVSKIKWDINKAQCLLNEKKYSLKQIADSVECTYKSIESAISRGILIKPKYIATTTYRKVANRKPVVRLSLDGKDVNPYNSPSEVKGFDASSI